MVTFMKATQIYDGPMVQRTHAHYVKNRDFLILKMQQKQVYYNEIAKPNSTRDSKSPGTKL